MTRQLSSREDAAEKIAIAALSMCFIVFITVVWAQLWLHPAPRAVLAVNATSSYICQTANVSAAGVSCRNALTNATVRLHIGSGSFNVSETR